MSEIKDFETYSLKDWLAYEYSEGMISTHKFENKFLKKGQYIKINGVKDENQKSLIYQGIYKGAETQHMVDLENLLHKREQKKESGKASLYQIVAKKTLLVKQQSEINESDYSQLITYLLGGQLFDSVLSNYFPKRRHPECYCALFYAAVVNGNIELATSLYEKYVSRIIKYHEKKEDTGKIVLQNIMCLYYLKTRSKSMKEILCINEQLISTAKEIKKDSLQAILWLNRSRLYKSNSDRNRAINSLEKSHDLLADNTLWKQNMYYSLQLAIIKDNLNKLLYNIFYMKSEDSTTKQKSMGWRISQILTGTNHYSHINVTITTESILKLESKSNINEIYESIIKE